MSVSPWVYAAGAAAVLVGGLVVAGQSAASSPAAPSPTPANPAAPIRITSGHRYEVTLTFGGPTTAAALLASIVPNLQVGLNTVAPNAYAFVHASAPNDRQVVYVVDAIAPPPGSTYAESPQTFQADLNAASMGGISVAVLDLGPSPISAPAPPPTGSPGPLTPPSPAPAGPLAPSSPVSDPALVSMAQSALAALITAGALTSPGGPVIVNGNPSDPATVAALVAYQNQTLLPAQRSGQLDYLTFGAAVTSALVHTGDPSKVGTDATITDAPTLTLAQTQLAAAIGRGFFPNIDYGAAQASGASDAAWQAAWTAAATQFNATAGKAILPTNGTLDRIGLAVILPFASLPLTLPDGTPIATPASPVTDFAEIGMAQVALQTLSAHNPAFGGVTINQQLDAPTRNAVAAYQAAQKGLQHRTSPGVLDTLTLASLLAEALVLTYGPTIGASPLPLAKGAPVTRAALVGAVEESVNVLSSGRLSPAGAGNVAADGNPASPGLVAALKTLAAYLNSHSGPALGFAVDTSGALDYNLFANLYVVAYM